MSEKEFNENVIFNNDYVIIKRAFYEKNFIKAFKNAHKTKENYKYLVNKLYYLLSLIDNNISLEELENNIKYILIYINE